MEMVAIYTIEEELTLEENTPNMPIRRFPSSSSSWLSKVILFNMLLIINFDNHQNKRTKQRLLLKTMKK